MTIRSSTFSPIYNTNPETENLIVEIANLNNSALETGGNLANINTKLPTSLGTKTAANSLSTTFSSADNSTTANVASTTTFQTLLAANSLAKLRAIVNDSTSILYIKFGVSASNTSYSYVLAPITNNIPASISFNGSDYSGIVTGIWITANGFARTTETT